MMRDMGQTNIICMSFTISVATKHKDPSMLIHKEGQRQWYISNVIDRVSEWKSELWARKPTTTPWGKPVLTKYFQHGFSIYLPVIPFTFLHFTFSNSLLTDRVLFWFYGLISPNRFCEVLLATGPSCSHTSSPLLPTNISHRTTITVEYTTTDSFFL